MNTEYISDVEVEVNVVDNGVVSLVVEGSMVGTCEVVKVFNVLNSPLSIVILL